MRKRDSSICLTPHFYCSHIRQNGTRWISLDVAGLELPSFSPNWDYNQNDTGWKTLGLIWSKYWIGYDLGITEKRRHCSRNYLQRRNVTFNLEPDYMLLQNGWKCGTQAQACTKKKSWFPSQTKSKPSHLISYSFCQPQTTWTISIFKRA